MTAEGVSVFSQTGAATRRVEVIHIPVKGFFLGRSWSPRIGNILYIVTLSAAHETLHPFRPERGDDAGCAPAPVIATEDRLFFIFWVNVVTQKSKWEVGGERKKSRPGRLFF